MTARTQAIPPVTTQITRVQTNQAIVLEALMQQAKAAINPGTPLTVLLIAANLCLFAAG